MVDDWPERKFSEQCWAHNLADLAKLATVHDELKGHSKVLGNWLLIVNWNEGHRYRHGKDQKTVEQFYDAIAHTTEGVLQWLKARW